MALGLVGTPAGAIQYKRVTSQIYSDKFVCSETLPLPLIMAVFLLIIGVLGLIAVLI